MILKCKKCGREQEEQFIESHHVWCKFMDNPHGYSSEWNKEMNRINLCRLCHDLIKVEVTLPILNKYARTLKVGRSESQLWKQVSPMDKQSCIKEIIELTKKWVGKKDGDTEATETKGN